MAQSEFVDLYELLGVPMEADIPAVRSRISTLYIEAQNNLDHRNAQRRLQYQQMYELYLPQARHLLLDAGRRAEYDRYLTAFRSGKPLAEVQAKPVAAATAPVTDIPEMSEVEEQVDPEVLAAEREQLWNKWKSALDTAEESSPGAPAATTASTPAAPRSATPAAPAARQATPQQAAAQQGANRPGTYLVGPRKGAPSAAAEEAEKAQTAEFERRRKAQREEMESSLAQTTGLVWSFVAGIATMLLLSLLLFIAGSMMQSSAKNPSGISPSTFNGIGYSACLLFAIVAAFVAGAKGRAKVIGELKSLSFEELQRRSR